MSSLATTSMGTPWRIISVACEWRSTCAVKTIPVRAAMRPISSCTVGRSAAGRPAREEVHEHIVGVDLAVFDVHVLRVQANQRGRDRDH